MYHILIVDEEEHLLWALERNLFPDREDVQLHTAGSGEVGLQVLEEESIDLLISDIKMPGEIDGFQLILRAKEKVPDARVMIITAFGTHRIKNFAERIGISHYIEKPFTVDELRNAVLEILDEKEGFQGVLSDLELTDIIQMLCLAKRTALLHLKHRDHRGRIVFDSGDVVHAQFDGEVGPEAVYAMLDLRQGDIFMQSDFDPVERTIEMGWQDMLLEGVKRADEQRLERQQEETRKELAEESSTVASDPADEGEDEAAWQRDASGRTRTPMGMGAPTMSDPPMMALDQEQETSLDEPSGGMLFSEAELEEISKASEAAIEDRKSGAEPGEQDSEPEVQDLPDQENAQDQTKAPDKEPSQEPSSPRSADLVGDQADRAGEERPNEEEPLQAVGEPDETSEQDSVVVVDDEQIIDELEVAGGNDSSAQEDNGTTREEAPTVEVSKELFAVAVQQSRSDQVASSEAPTQWNDPLKNDGEEVAEASPEKRNRRGTSPGMAAVSPVPDAALTEESGEFELFAAPALNGRTNAPENRVASAGQLEEDAAVAIEEFIEECPGLKATALISRGDLRATQFVNLGYQGELDEVALAQGVAEVFTRAERSVRALDAQDRIEELQFVVDGDYLLMRFIEGWPQIHVAIVDRKVSLGIALVLMRQFGKQVAQAEG